MCDITSDNRVHGMQWLSQLRNKYIVGVHLTVASEGHKRKHDGHSMECRGPPSSLFIDSCLLAQGRHNDMGGEEIWLGVCISIM